MTDKTELINNVKKWITLDTEIKQLQKLANLVAAPEVKG
jgi:hypothetical protein